MLDQLTQQQVELAFRLLDQAVQSDPPQPLLVPPMLRHLTDEEWDALCVAAGARQGADADPRGPRAPQEGVRPRRSQPTPSPTKEAPSGRR